MDVINLVQCLAHSSLILTITVSLISKICAKHSSLLHLAINYETERLITLAFAFSSSIASGVIVAQVSMI
jgi:hypothetical protein